jgi:TRAP-type transport system periplasmic protein
MNYVKCIAGRKLLPMALAACGLIHAADQPPRIKLATILPRGTSTHHALLEMSAKWRDAGVTPTLYTDGVMGGEAETVRRMRIDQLQAAVLSVAGLMEIDHSVGALQLMPMMFHSLDEVAYVRDRLRPLLEKRLEDKGFVVLFWADAGWVQIFSKKPVLHPDDLRKQKIFALNSDSGQSDLMKAAGFQAVALEYTDTLTGLQTGLIDVVPTPPFYALAGQFYLPAPYMLELNYAPLVGALVVTRKAWDSVPTAARDTVRRAAEQAGKDVTVHGHEEMRAAVDAMQKRGLKVTQLTPAAEAEWRSLCDGLYPKIRGNIVPADLFDEVQRLLREYRK